MIGRVSQLSMASESPLTISHILCLLLIAFSQFFAIIKKQLFSNIFFPVDARDFDPKTENSIFHAENENFY